MVDYEFIENQKQRLIELVEKDMQIPISSELEKEISRILHQVASNEANREGK